MKIIISPAKEMSTENDFLDNLKTPILLEKAKPLFEYMKCLSYSNLQDVLKCNDKLAMLNYNRYQSGNIDSKLVAALLAYDGIAYKYMAPQVFDENQFAYVNKHLRIISGLYGLLRPMDGIIPYRLEMQAKIHYDTYTSLYDYWKDAIYQELTKDTTCIVNLASKEYSKIIEAYLTPDVSFIDVVFGEMVNGKLVEKGVFVKMARGAMVRYMASNNVTTIEGIKSFNELGYTFSEAINKGNKTTLVFIKG
ncbi:MAG: peroxide stress protein YaaA [Erysipelotrichales bacterium]|nr:peroxide stress protein YaaA [Erysipelotrichales bacterium]